jgi:hypothetical protein
MSKVSSLAVGIMSRWAAAGLAGLIALGLAGCASPQVQDYASERPLFDFKGYFSGEVSAAGLVSDRSGKVTRSFVVAMRGSWSGDVGTLDEQFVYNDGERQHRVWQVRQTADGRYVGTAGDVVGDAQGATAGSAFNWHYTLRVPVRGEVYDIQFDDWMHRVDAHTVINKAVMSKFGVRVGEVTLSFHKP